MMVRAIAVATAAMLVAAPVGGVAVAKEPAKHASALKGQMILYKKKNFEGDAYTIDQTMPVVELDWNIGSIGIGPETKFEICAKPRYKDPCMVLDTSVPVAADIGIMGGIGSARPK